MIFEFNHTQEAELTYQLRLLPITHKLLALPKELKDNEVNITKPITWNQKEIGYKLLQYFALTEDPDSPYYKYPYESRCNEVKKILFQNNQKLEEYLTNPTYKSFCEIVKPLLVTPEQRMVDSYFRKIEEIQMVLDNNVCTMENIDAVVTVMTKLDKVIELGKKLKAEVENKKTGKSRGNAELSLIESGILGMLEKQNNE
jgi:hypothetical protein